MLLKTNGIIFRAIKYGETSLIVDVYTREKGLKKYIISGVRTRKSKTQAGLFQVMTQVDLVAYDRPDRDLHRIKEIRNAYIYQELPYQVPKSAIGMFMLEVARKTIREQEDHPELYDFLAGSFQFLDRTQDSISNLHLLFMVELSHYLGFTPTLEPEVGFRFFDMKEGIFCRETPPHAYFLDEDLSRILADLLHTPAAEVHHLRITKAQRSQLLEKLLDYYRLHIENFPTIHAHTILKTVLG